MYFYLKSKSSTGRAHKKSTLKNFVPTSKPNGASSRQKKLPSVLVPNGIQLAPKQKGNSQHDPVSSSLKGNSKPLEVTQGYF